MRLWVRTIFVIGFIYIICVVKDLFSTVKTRNLEVPWVKTSPEPFVIGSIDDPWIIPGLLSKYTSPFSTSDDWHLLHMLCWTTGAETFQERHYQALETIWTHEPRAILFMMSTSLPLDFFETYTKHGYAIHIVRIGGTEMLEMGWYLGSESEKWLGEWDRWSKGVNFYSHLTDYLRYLFLFKYGGTYLDMDAPWVRSPPNSNLEFIGADYATLASDLDWTLDSDGMYLAPGVMRFKKGWTLFKDIMEASFSISKYRIDCFNCVGPRAITLGVKPQRKLLELNGFTILPNTVLYPKNWETSHELVKSLSEGEARKELRKIIEGSWSIHLFGKMTNHLKIQEGSIVGEAFDYFSLRIPRRIGYLSSADKEFGTPKGLGEGMELVLPQVYLYRSRSQLLALETTKNINTLGSVDGRFEGLDLIFIRGTKLPLVDNVEISISTSNVGTIAWASSSARLSGMMGGDNRDGGIVGGTELNAKLGKSTLRDVNVILGSLVYLPGRVEKVKKDVLTIKVVFGDEVTEGKIRVHLE